MNRALQILITILILIACNKDDQSVENEKPIFISAVDISSYPEILNSNPIFYDMEGNEEDFLTILKNNRINTVRLRLWINPINGHSGYNEVKQFSMILKQNGFKTWLSVHYSDTWADPSQQAIPAQWEGVDFSPLKDSVYNYTEKIMTELQPDYIQIGNEINHGFLHPYGHITNTFEQFKELMDTAIIAVRTNSNDTEIILHYAGIEDSEWFFNQVGVLDYDIIGLSYYPIWHGKSLISLQSTMLDLSSLYDKKIVIAETAYPFTLEWNDLTNNVVGLEEHLILPDYPASAQGQKDFIKEIRIMTKDLERAIGFCYWGAELIAWKGNQSPDASPWENQAIFDFNNKILPVLVEFQSE